MAAKIIVEIPKAIRNRIDILTHENFFLWMFISNQDLWEEARDFLDNASQRPLSLDHWLDTGMFYDDDGNCPPFDDNF